jgi:sortase A
MGLTIPALELRNVPVLSGRGALTAGVEHVSGTDLPWRGDAQRNVYLAGHRLGYPGTGSRLIFYRLDELSKGDRIVLKDRRGRAYRYRVLDSFVVGPYDSWVMGEVRDRDLLTLQTCTPVPTFDKRLIVRAERI